MKTNLASQGLWNISVVVAPAAEDAAVELLSSHFAQPATSYFDLESQESTVSVYLDRKPRWTRAAQADLRNALRPLTDFGLNLGDPVIRLSKLRRQDWAESWKRHFRPLEIGRALLIKPSWSRRRPRRGQAVIILDPGLSFGTGQHPTTGFCLEQIVAQSGGNALKSPLRSSFLDIGTGSGILALAAASLGYEPIVAFDFDADAVRIAKQNAQVNHLCDRIVYQRRDVHRLPLEPRRTYSVVCANLTADLLLKCRDRIIAQVSPGGTLVLAGILRTEFREVQRDYEAAGVRLARSRHEGEWQSATFNQRGKEVKTGRLKTGK